MEIKISRSLNNKNDNHKLTILLKNNDNER